MKAVDTRQESEMRPVAVKAIEEDGARAGEGIKTK